MKTASLILLFSASLAIAGTNSFNFNGLALGQRPPTVGTTNADRSLWAASEVKGDRWAVVPSKTYPKNAPLKEPACGLAELARTNGVVSQISVSSPMLQNHIAAKQWAQQAVALIELTEGKPLSSAQEMDDQSGGRLRSRLKKSGKLEIARWKTAILMLYLKPPGVQDTSDKWKYCGTFSVILPEDR